jgi:peptide/nickel transport system substrate-binding protein
MNSPSPQLTRRLLLGGSLAGLAVGTFGCSTERTAPGAGASGGAANDGIFTVNFVGGLSQYYQNWNPFSPAENVGSGTNWFYEPLMRLSRFDAWSAEPWLAESWETNDDYTELTFKLRSDVTWSDGKPFTADDVIFSLTVASEKADANLVMTDYQIDDISSDDGSTIKIKMKESDLGNLNRIGQAPMYPAHVFGDQDLEKWTNPEPIGTGPFTLGAFSPQQVTLDLRDDYWNGTFEHVKQVKWAVFANEDSGKALVRQGKIDMATMSWPNAETTIESEGPGNMYEVYSTGGGEALLYNCAKAPFDDVAVRQAVSKAIDFAKVMSLYDVGAGLGSMAGMAEAVWSDYIADEYKGKTIAADPAGAKKALADGGWTVEGGKLTKDGKSYSISIKAVAEYVNWATWCDGIKQQLKDVLGIDLAVLKIPADQQAEQVVQGKFDIAMDWAGGGNLAGEWFGTGNAGMNKADIVPIGEDAGANACRFSNDRATELLDELAGTFDEEKTKELVKELQRIYVEERPYLVYNTGGNFVEMNGSKWAGLVPAADRPDYAPLLYGFPDTTLLLQNLKPAAS